MKLTKDPQAMLLLSVHGLFILSSALSGTFLNVYLWKSRQDYTMLGWFTIAQQVALGLTFWAAGKWVKEHNKMNALRLGIAVSGLFYLCVLWAGRDAVHYIWPLGLLFGVSLGLFWLAFNVVYFEISNAENRDWFNGWIGLLGSVTGIIGPWLAGWVITWMHGDEGYRLIFTVSLVIFAAAVVLSFFLRKRPVQNDYNWLEGLRRLKEGGVWKYAVWGLAVQGMREGVFSFLITLLVFVATDQESKLGQFALITSAVSLVSYWACGKWFKPQFRKIGMLVGAVLMLLVILPLLLAVNYTTLLVLGIGTSLFIPLYMMPAISVSFDLMGLNQENVEKRVELVVLRELSLTLGRITGLLVFILVLSINQDTLTITLLLLFLGASPIGSWLFMRRLFPSKEQVT
ncbi:MFS transporter [Paenibacillus glucanolyticus]|uniref:MFS transporter n=2 Tax=Paenibacillus glucanolyticus TaxID=59843 RepID=A0A163FMS8_9BACL|nr:MFS transporter [Paenibacillus glucanolyticus]KZS44478.1 MFS transporter [Paenibacillus glucanolyticus]